jgi:hypothetical protein
MNKPSLEVFVRDYLRQIVLDAESTFDRDRLKASMRMLDGFQLLLMQTELGRSRILSALRGALENLSHGHPDPFFDTVSAPRHTPTILMFQALASVAMQLRKMELESTKGKQTAATQEAANWVAAAINKECGRLRRRQHVTAKTVIEWRRGFTAPRGDKRSKRSDVTAAVIYDGYQDFANAEGISKWANLALLHTVNMIAGDPAGFLRSAPRSIHTTLLKHPSCVSSTWTLDGSGRVCLEGIGS